MGGGCPGKHVVPGSRMLCALHASVFVFMRFMCVLHGVNCVLQSLCGVCGFSFHITPSLSVATGSLCQRPSSARYLEKLAMTHVSGYTIFFSMFILGCLAIIISVSNGTRLLYSRSKESGHMSTANIRKREPWFSHSISTIHLCSYFIVSLMTSLCHQTSWYLNVLCASFPNNA